MDTCDIARLRSILFSARVRFTPEAQPVKETAIDKIIEQTLLLTSKPLSLKDIEDQKLISLGGVSSLLRGLDIGKSLNRLVGTGRVDLIIAGTEKKYKLKKSTEDELWDIHKSSESRLKKVVDRLFKDAVGGSDIYFTPFLECLSKIFSALGEAYVRVLKGTTSADEILSYPIVKRSLNEAKSRYRTIDHQLFESSVFTFFREADPDYTQIKWNFAQNYYILKALGLDPSGFLLTKELFGDAQFYLDTNIIIQALEPKAQYYNSWLALSQACKKLNTAINVCKISLDECKNAALNYKGMIKKNIVEKIPIETLPKVKGVFFQLYLDAKNKGGTPDLDALFNPFLNPMDVLAKEYNVNLVDDFWFDNEKNNNETNKLAEIIKNKYIKVKKRPKGDGAARHDALLFRWLQKIITENTHQPYLVTLDTTLPTLSKFLKKPSDRPFAISLDVLLQWISPFAFDEGTEEQAAAVYAEAIKYQLLPIENIFDLRDFIVFADVDVSSKELPAKDVEGFIRYLRANWPRLNPASPTDREKIARELIKYLADPGREYKKEVSRLEEEKKSEITKRDGKIKEIIETNEQIKTQTQEAHNLEVSKLHGQLAVTEAKLQSLRAANEIRNRRIKNGFRILASLVLLAFLFILSINVSNSYGVGPNIIQKMISCWKLLVVGFVLWLIICYYILGKDLCMKIPIIRNYYK